MLGLLHESTCGLWHWARDALSLPAPVVQGKSLSEDKIWDYERDFLSHGVVDSKKVFASVTNAGDQLKQKFGHASSGEHFL